MLTAQSLPMSRICLSRWHASWWIQAELKKGSFKYALDAVSKEMRFTSLVRSSRISKVALTNRPFPSFLVPLFQSESKCETILMEITLIWMRMKLHAELIFIWKVSHLDSFSDSGTRELGNGLLSCTYNGSHSHIFVTRRWIWRWRYWRTKSVGFHLGKRALLPGNISFVQTEIWLFPELRKLRSWSLS